MSIKEGAPQDAGVSSKMAPRLWPAPSVKHGHSVDLQCLDHAIEDEADANRQYEEADDPRNGVNPRPAASGAFRRTPPLGR